MERAGLGSTLGRKHAARKVIHKATKKEKNSMQFSELTRSKYKVISAHPSKHQTALRRGRDYEYFSQSCVSQCLVEG